MKKEIKKGEIIIYQAPDKKVAVDVSLDQGTVWLNQDQIAKIFTTERSSITKHINNVIKSGELAEKSNVQKWNIANSDKPVKFYSLDMIISIGYRVNSKRATQFRIWATRTLKDHLVKGYTINEKRLREAQSKFKELQGAIDFLREKSKSELLQGQEQEILDLLAGYSKTLTLLEQYDKDKVVLAKNGKTTYVLTYEESLEVIKNIKTDLRNKKEASELFGAENSERLKGILGSIYQTFDKKELYASIEEKAAHLLYFIIKDHPLIDGNKRTASFLFVYFLDKNNYLYREYGEKKINDNALVALALLIAVSDQKEKDVMIKLITNLIQ